MKRILLISALPFFLLASCSTLPPRRELTPAERARMEAADEIFAQAEDAYHDAENDFERDEAFARIRKAAEMGSPDAMYFVGFHHYKLAEAGDEDRKQAVRWLQAAAEWDHAPAMSTLGVVYLQGHGIARNPGTAYRLFRRAAREDNAAAMYNLGLMYLTGAGIRQDDSSAADWFEKAAERGDVPSMVFLGNLYLRGRGVITSYRNARKWFTKAAKAENAEAMYLLGLMAKNGVGQDKDLEQMAFWFHMAAARGHKIAAERLQKLKALEQVVTRIQQSQETPTDEKPTKEAPTSN